MIISDDPVMRTRAGMHFEDDEMIITNQQDVTDLVELNRAHYNSVDERARCARDGEMVASIPLVTYFELVKNRIAHDEKRFRVWLDDPANRFFRTHPTRLTKAGGR